MDLELIRNILREVIHPVTGKNILAMGLAEGLKAEETENGLSIKFRLVSEKPDEHLSSIKESCLNAIKSRFPQASVSIIELIRQKKQDKAIKGEPIESLNSIDKIIAIASGKGGVGKSTVAVNLAITLQKMGYKVGLLDADIYGPSIPIMTATEEEMPVVEQINEQDTITPVDKYGIKWLSMGYFIPKEQALIWRGPMASNAMKQLITQGVWGELDFLLIDLPPGTGDIYISMIHDIPVSGAIIVTTPQKVALADVLKGINLFNNKDVQTNIYGAVENMSWFTPEELPDSKYYIFGKNGGVEMAKELGIPFLGHIPIVKSISDSGDSGTPAALENGTIVSEAFLKIAEKIINF